MRQSLNPVIQLFAKDRLSVFLVRTQASSTRTIITDIAEAADRSSTNESLKAAFVSEFLSRSDQNRKARTSNSL